MFTARNSRPQAEENPRVVTAYSLKEAYRKVRLLHGDNAVIQGTRTVSVRMGNGLGTKKMVEVTVGEPGIAGQGTRPVVRPRPEIAPQAQAVQAELDRIDDLVADVQVELERVRALEEGPDPTSAASFLESLGTSRETVSRLAHRYRAEKGQEPAGRDAFLSWLTGKLPAAECDWDGFYGSHAFLGLDRHARQELVFRTCAQFRELGREVLLLVAFPEHEGTIARLQAEASRHGYDAAVIRRPQQLQSCQEHFGDYDAVLFELPDLDDPVLAEFPEFQTWLVANTGFHRHMVVSLAADLPSAETGADLARTWNCDWLAVSRPRRFDREGKILDLLELISLPVSLDGASDREGGGVRIARASDLVGRLSGVTDPAADTLLAAVAASARGDR